MEFASLQKEAPSGAPGYAICEGDMSFFVYCNIGESIMAILATSVVLAAAGYSLLYLLFGGGLGGAVLIFIVAKMLGK
jgi:hypothetical protein